LGAVLFLDAVLKPQNLLNPFQDRNCGPPFAAKVLARQRLAPLLATLFEIGSDPMGPLMNRGVKENFHSLLLSSGCVQRARRMESKVRLSAVVCLSKQK